MGKNKSKSVQAKKLQRRKQKLKKRLKKSSLSPSRISLTPHSSSGKQTDPCGPLSMDTGGGGSGNEECLSSIFASSFGSPGSPPCTASTITNKMSIDAESTGTVNSGFDIKTAGSNGGGDISAGSDINSENYFQELVDQHDKETLDTIQSYTLDHQCVSYSWKEHRLLH